MRVLILGATGRCGTLFVREALAASHSVVVYVRSPEKLPADLASHPQVTVHKGTLDDASALSRALSGSIGAQDNSNQDQTQPPTPVDAVLSALGPRTNMLNPHPAGEPLGHAHSLLIRLMKDAGVRRLIALGTPTIDDPLDKPALTNTLAVGVMRFTSPTTYADIRAVGRVVREEGEAAGLQWTLPRVPLLKDGPGKEWYVGYVGDVKGGFYLNRAAYASFVIHELEHGEWVGKAPVITNA
ncbi:oxidoreductase [Coniophora puteana RWD-64-598 SS2]|uniref:Oxidoreductase n=1 Tax=Coniophora puteana (strain RWD-64-598) TaxID=741705 RepID=A0A5M3MFE0_CONPW|nr:oxidoreductase [Coniophora puteana RWD-64-598 SS2]EIW77335.1 oxidoreductase [Coniophora puteana RWD-64-598 SS2]